MGPEPAAQLSASQSGRRILRAATRLRELRRRGQDLEAQLDELVHATTQYDVAQSWDQARHLAKLRCRRPAAA
jgi:hypothetical protein